MLKIYFLIILKASVNKQLVMIYYLNNCTVEEWTKDTYLKKTPNHSEVTKLEDMMEII